MRCPACNTENAREATTCAKCQATLPARRKQRRRGVPEEVDTPFSPYVVGPNRRSMRAYRLAVYGLIPGAGLLLGPLAVVLGLRARRRGKNDPEFTTHNAARAAVILGGLVALTNWVGLALMVVGWSRG